MRSIYEFILAFASNVSDASNASDASNVSEQQQTSFVLYMIVGSYFHKSTCTNKVLEKQLYLHYREMPFRQQCGLEERVIKDTEKELGELLPALAELNCTVSIRRRGGEYHLWFNTGFEGVSVRVNGNGGYRIQAVGECKAPISSPRNLRTHLWHPLYWGCDRDRK